LSSTRSNQRKLSCCCQHCTKELHARQKERKSQSPFSITMRTNVEWTCLTQCVDRCQRRLAAGDGHLLSSSTFSTSPVSMCGHYSERRQVYACHGVSSCVSCQQKHQSRHQAANSSICIIVFNNGSFWKKSSCQVKSVCKHNRTTTVCDVCKRPVCGKCIDNVCKQCQP